MYCYQCIASSIECAFSISDQKSDAVDQLEGKQHNNNGWVHVDSYGVCPRSDRRERDECVQENREREVSIVKY